MLPHDCVSSSSDPLFLQIVIDKEGKSALHWAASAGSYATSKAILDYWMSPSRRNAGEAELNVDVLNMMGKSLSRESPQRGEGNRTQAGDIMQGAVAAHVD